MSRFLTIPAIPLPASRAASRNGPTKPKGAKSMSRKHFDSLARELAAVRPPDMSGDAYQVWLNAAWAVARSCGAANPRFEADRFMAACESW